MASRFEHESFKYPTIFRHEMLAFIQHGFPLKFRTARLYQANRIPTGVGINTIKDVPTH